MLTASATGSVPTTVRDRRLKPHNGPIRTMSGYLSTVGRVDFNLLLSCAAILSISLTRVVRRGITQGRYLVV
jgi:hypothetical protein